jgi:hypothetical protein
MKTHTLLSVLSLALGAIFASTALSQDVLPRPHQPFKGKIRKTLADSQQDFPQPIAAPKDAPSVVLILLDDLGFCQPSTSGGLIKAVSIYSEQTQPRKRFSSTCALDYWWCSVSALHQTNCKSQVAHPFLCLMKNPG